MLWMHWRTWPNWILMATHYITSAGPCRWSFCLSMACIFCLPINTAAIFETKGVGNTIIEKYEAWTLINRHHCDDTHFSSVRCDLLSQREHLGLLSRRPDNDHISTKTTPNIQKLNVRNICYRYIKKPNKSQSLKRWGSKCKLSRRKQKRFFSSCSFIWLCSF